MGRDITHGLRKLIDGIEEIKDAHYVAITNEMDTIDGDYDYVVGERDAAEDRAAGMPDEDEIDTDVRDRVARELEPIFAAIHLGDLDRARGGVRQLAGVLGGNDPILIAIQRAKSRPRLHVHVAA